jgi:hypothetical protein
MVVETTETPTTITELTPHPRRKIRNNNSINNLRKGKKFQKDTILASFATRSHFGYVPLDELEVDYTYQRNPDKKRISVMAHQWNQDLAGAIVVNQRENGKYYVVDGQQRLGAMQRIDNKPDRAWAQIFEGLTLEQEAMLFHELDTKRYGLTKGAIFTALVAAKDKAALEILEAARENGMEIDYHAHPGPGYLRAYDTLMQIHRRRGKERLSQIIRIVSKAWPNDRNAGAAAILVGLERFIERYPKANERHLIDALSKRTPREIENLARTLSNAMSSALGAAAGRAIMGLYNKGLTKNRLPAWKE